MTEAEAFIVSVEPRFAPLVDKHGPCVLVTTAPPDNMVACLAGAICSQQLSTKAADTIFRRLATQFGDGVHVDVRLVDEASLESLRAVGLSWAKAGYLKDLAARALAGTIPSLSELDLRSEDEIVAELTAVKGIGRWTVEMLLMFRLGRLDVWPVDDLGIRAGWTKLMGLEERLTPKALTFEGERFRPYRSVAAWYLWRILED